MKTPLLAGLVVLGACGGADQDLVPDPTRVTLEARDRLGGPVAGLTAWGHDAAGLLVDQGATSADGIVRLDIPLGGSATIKTSDDGLYAYWRTIAGVEPGDVIPIRLSTPSEPFPTPDQTLTVTLPALPSGATQVAMRSPCASGQAQGNQVALEASCDGPTTVIATARAANGDAMAYLVIPDVDLRPLTTLTPSGAWTAPSPWTVEVLDVPAGVRYVSTSRYLGEQYGGHYDSGYAGDLTTGGRATIAGTRPDVGGLVTFTAYTGPWNGGYRNSLVTTRQPADAYTLDFDDLLASPVLAMPDGRAFTWSGSPGADLYALNYEVAEGTGDVIGKQSSWYVTAPPTATSFAFPADIGFPFPDTAEPPTRIYAIGVRAWDHSWLERYRDVRFDDVPRPADFTSTSSYDGFSIYNPES